MTIFSVIITFNALRNDWLYKCLNSLISSELSTEIIVVDNASTDKTCQVIKEKYPSVILIENYENKGFGAANNQGFEYGIKNGADYIFLLNQDAWIEKDSILRLIMQSEKNPQFGVISPLHLNVTGTAMDYNFSNYLSPHYCKSLYSDFVLNRVEERIYELPFVNAAAWLLPKKTMEVVGGFSPSFFHYGEDDNYCHRVLFHQLKIGVYPFAKIFHDRENRLATPKENFDREKAWRLKYSNPLIEYSVAAEITVLKRNLLKNKIMQRKDSIDRDRTELNFLVKMVPQLDIYRKESQTRNSYKFLNI